MEQTHDLRERTSRILFGDNHRDIMDLIVFFRSVKRVGACGKITPHLGNFKHLIRGGDEGVEPVNGRSWGNDVKERVDAVCYVLNLV